MKNNGRLAVIVLGYLAVLTAVAYLIFIICAWMNRRAEDGAKGVPTVSDSAIAASDEDGLSGEEAWDELLVRMQEQALSDAQADKEAAVVAASADARAEVLAGIKAGLAEGDTSMVEVLRPFYPDDIVLVSGGKFHFIPINRNLKMNQYTNECLNVLENGEFQYLENGEVISHKGIDVSKFQGKIDWNAVAADGVEFAFIRVAYRGYGSAGKLMDDAMFDNNMSGAIRAGIHPGVYIYSQAITEEEVLEEAELVMKKLEPYKVKCPIVFDVEKTAEANGRMNQLSLEERTNLTLLFCKTVEEAGYKAIIYHNMEMATMMIDIETFEAYEKWFAYYSDNMYYPYEYAIWQYSEKGKVKGIDGNVDLNISFRAFWEE